MNERRSAKAWGALPWFVIGITLAVTVIGVSWRARAVSDGNDTAVESAANHFSDVVADHERRVADAQRELALVLYGATIGGAETDELSDISDRLERLGTSDFSGLTGFGLVHWEDSPVVEGYGSTFDDEELSALGNAAATGTSGTGEPWVAALRIHDEDLVIVGLNINGSSSLIAGFDASTFLLGDTAGHSVMADLEAPSSSNVGMSALVGMDEASGMAEMFGGAPGGDAIMIRLRGAAEKFHPHGGIILHNHSGMSDFSTLSTVDVCGEPWTLSIHTVDGFLDRPSSREVFVVGLVGALLSIALFVLMYRTSKSHQLKRERLRMQEDLISAQAELVNSQKLESIGRLAAGIAHEINTPMQYIGDNTHFLNVANTRLLSIAGAAQDFLETNPDIATGSGEDLATAIAASKLSLLRERAPKAADDALAGVKNVSQIVQAMKRFSHPDSDTKELIDINTAIATTLTVCRNEWKYAADVETNLDPDLPLIEAHLGLLNQVWLNMIVNAAHAVADRHGETKGTITITTATSDDDHVIITIADDGAGIEPDDLTRIFDYFFTTKDVGRGTGQGLAIAHQAIVTDHGGTITVDSALGHGTTFTVTLPVTSRSVPQGATA